MEVKLPPWWQGSSGDTQSRKLHGSPLTCPVYHARCPPRPVCPALPSSLVAFPDLSIPPNDGKLGSISFSLKKNFPVSTFPPACSPNALGPHPLFDCLRICEMSSYGTSLARSYLGQHAGLPTSTSSDASPPRSAWASGTRQAPAGVMAFLQTWLQSVGWTLGTRRISLVSLSAPVDNRAPRTAPEAGNLSTLRGWVLRTGLSCLCWSTSRP